MSHCICFIGARSGSKRLVEKNKRMLMGKPLYQYAIEAASSSDLFSHIIFSTDDEDIQVEITKNFPMIMVDKRPDSLCDDDVVWWDVQEYLLNKYENLIKEETDVILLWPCHPLRNEKHIIDAYSLYNESQGDFLVSVTEMPSPKELSVSIQENRIIRETNASNRKGDYPKCFYSNGAIVIMKPQKFRHFKTIYTDNTIGYILPWPYSLDIDTNDDLQLAEKLMPTFYE